MNKEELQFASAFQGKEIYGILFEPDSEIKGLVQIIHGFAEHIGRYEPFMRFLAEQGYVVFGDDHLGHGLTALNNGMQLSDVGTYDAPDYMLQDEWHLNQLIKNRYSEKIAAENSAAAVAKAVERENGESVCTDGTKLPCYILGHSMGSLMLRALLFVYPEICDKAIIMGTGDMSPGLLKIFGGILSISEFFHKGNYRSKFINYMGVGKNSAPYRADKDRNAWISANQENVKAYSRDQLSGNPGSLHTFRFLQKLMTAIRKKENLQKMNKDLPVLFLSGAEDAFGEMGKGPRTVCNLFREAGLKNVDLILYPGMRHEVLNESHQERVYQDILTFFDA